MLADAEASGKLVRFCPDYDLDESEKRELWLTPGLSQWLGEKDRRQHFKPRVRGHLKHFVVGGFVDNEEYMKPLSDDVVEFRVQFESRPVPENTRIFGAFIQQDHFVATSWKPRSWFANNKGRWSIEIDKVKSEWALLFGDKLRVPTAPFRNCVSDNGWDRKRDEQW